MSKNAIDLLLSAMPQTTKTVTVSGVEVELTPLTLRTISVLIRRFPEAMKLIFGQSENPLAVIVNCGPEAVSAVISAGLGKLNDIENEKKIAQLPDEVALEILSEIVVATMPEGIERFLEKFVPHLEKMGMIMISKKDGSVQIK